ncbi:MAG: DNA translocase FtsK [Candidatus Ratteibacteria bacterium]|nr:DNA translocase FtsK [Candidatus Ratteibacteria bacterium]
MGRKKAKPQFKINPELRREIFGIVILALAAFIVITLITFRPGDSSFFQIPPNRPPHNFGGLAGVFLSSFLFNYFGWTAYLIPLLLVIWGWRNFRRKETLKLFLRCSGILLIFVALSTFFQLYPVKLPSLGFLPGGIIGAFFKNRLSGFLGQAGITILIITFFLLGILLYSRRILFAGIFYFFVIIWKLFFLSGRLLAFLALGLGNFLKAGFGKIKKFIIQKRKEPKINLPDRIKQVRLEEKTKVERIKLQKKLPRVKLQPAMPGEYRIPPISFLDEPAAEKPELKENLKEQAKILEETLSNFGIKAKVTQINRGPVITEYEVQPAPGIKISRIVGLADNIALAMSAPSVRVVAPIPGKAVVGIEIPNRSVVNVYLREIITHPDYEKSSSRLTMALGKDISGRPLITDLTDMPHLLIAGATGSGKTICINALITSILFKATPQEVKFILIDPKRVELINFNNLPHLITPVVTSPKKASAALKWLVGEMEKRYKIFAEDGVRNIESYNKKSANEREILPYIVVVIDELADLMMTVPMEVEEAVTRLAQLSRAVGIHIVLATQRPSVDVITGVIKANFPSRISFQVSSKVDSRTVLDMNGAETLLGKGDMLFLPPGRAKPIRAQGALINDREIKQIVAFISEKARPAYNEEIFAKEEKGDETSLGTDELFDQAVEIVLETGQASASVLQRRLRVGYARAARLIDMMEEKQIVGPHRGSRSREILANHSK